MKLDIKKIEHLAGLALLELTNNEKKKFSEQLSSILDYVNQLEKVDTKNVEPTSHITGLENVTRPDEVHEVDLEVKEKLLEAAPEVEDRLIKTKSVFKK